VNAPSPIPVVVYLHSDFAFAPAEWRVATPFLNGGFAVLAPMLRGENGNPGNHELLWGELDDVMSAIDWVCAQPGIDSHRIFVFGRGAGGALAALVSLAADPGCVRLTGSTDGLYQEAVFQAWAAQGLVPFDPDDPAECDLRLLLPNLRDMTVAHIAYIGEDEGGGVRGDHNIARHARAAADEVGAPLTVQIVGGGFDYRSAVSEFLLKIQGIP
jgi:dienelactone hydrolase